MLVTGCAYLTPQEEAANDSVTAPSEDNTTEPPVIDDSSSTEVVPSTVVVDAVETSVAQSTSTSTTTIPDPLGVDELILKSDGLGGAAFGTEPEAVVSYVSSILGSPTDDSDWVPPDEFSCPGTAVRRVKWGVLSLMFGDQSLSADGRAHFMSYTYGVVDKFGEEPTGLRTSDGVSITDSVGSLLERIDVKLDGGDADLDIPPSFFYEREPFPISGLLSGTDVNDVVLVISSGSGCLG
jgi:hypothetical protein